MGWKYKEPDIIKILKEEEKIGKLKSYLENNTEQLSNSNDKNKINKINILDSKDFFKNIVKNSPDGIVFVNKLGIIKYSNKSGAKLLGYNDEKNIIGKHFSKIGAFKKSEISKYLKLFGTIIRGKNPGLLEIEYQKKDGSTFLAEVKVELLKNKYDKKIGIIAVSRDITDRKKFENKIKDNENKFRTLSELTSDFCYKLLINKNTNISNYWLLEVFFKISGYSTKDIKNIKEWKFLIHKDDQNKVKNHIKSLLNGKTSTAIYRIKTKSGKQKWLKDYAKTNYDDENNLIIYGAIKEITEEKKYEKSITDSKINLQNLYDSIADPIVIVDSKGKFLDMNESVSRYTGYNREELIGKNFLRTKIVTKKSKIILLTNLTKRMAGIEIKPYTVEIVTKKGERLPFEVNAQKIEYLGKSADIVIFRDISERIKTEKALKSSEIKYRTLFETSNDGIFIAKLSKDMKFIDCNPKACQLFDCKKEEIIGKSPLVFSPEYQPNGLKSKDLILKNVENILKGIDSEIIEWKHKKLNGEIFDAEVSLDIIDIEGQKYMQGIVRDVTDKKKAEIILKESEEKYRALFYNNVDLLFMHDIKNNEPANFIDVNEKFCKLVGFSKDELLEMNMKNLVDKDLHSQLNNNILKLIKGEDVLFETKLVNRNKEKIPIEIHKSIVNINEKKVVLGIGRDITERKIAEEEVKKLASVVKHSGELVNLATLEGKMIFLNEAGEKMLGINKNQVKNHIIYDVIPDDLKLIVKNQVVPSIINKGIWQGELRYKNIDTLEETYVQAYTFVINDPDTNEPLYLANVSRDITEQKRYEKKLEKAHNELKDLNDKLEEKVKNRTNKIQYLLKQKDEFINQLGHDLKNPLGPMVNLLPIVEKEEQDPKLKEIIQVIIRNVEYMRNLVIKTIQLARLNSTKSEFNFENANLFQIIEKIIKNNELNLIDNKINFEYSIDKKINIKLDKLRFEELMNNLIDNSIKYSKKPGKIIIESKKDKDFITISIKDNGLGMTENQINLMFDEFYKADESRHDFDSSGLGLTISKKIVEKHGGKIWAESEGIDKGSTFYFTIPNN